MNDRPWMTALEMQFAALRRNRDYVRHQTNLSWLNHVSAHLRHAECYSFTAETAAAIALASRTIPMNSRVGRAVFPCPSGWWWFDRPVTVAGLCEHSDQCEGMSWGPSERGVWIFGWLRDYNQAFHRDPMPVFSEHCLGDSSLSELQATSSSGKDPDEAATKAASLHIWRFLMAGATWLQQRVVISSPGHIERHRRKQLAREHNVPLPSDVKVIQLRRAESQSHEPRPDGLDPIEWSCRWIVNGHWRNQPYKDERKLIYILPYVKGPDDKPLKVPTHTVYQVSR